MHLLRALPSVVGSSRTGSCISPAVASHVLRVQPRQVTVHSANLAQKRCEPCEASHDAMEQMGLSMIMDQETAEKYRAEVSSRVACQCSLGEGRGGSLGVQNHGMSHSV